VYITSYELFCCLLLCGFEVESEMCILQIIVVICLAMIFWIMLG